MNGARDEAPSEYPHSDQGKAGFWFRSDNSRMWKARPSRQFAKILPTYWPSNLTILFQAVAVTNQIKRL